LGQAHWQAAPSHESESLAQSESDFSSSWATLVGHRVANTVTGPLSKRAADGDRNAALSYANKSFADHRVTGDPAQVQEEVGTGPTILGTGSTIEAGRRSAAGVQDKGPADTRHTHPHKSIHTHAQNSLYSPSRPIRGNQAVLPTQQVRRPHPSNQGVGTGLSSIRDAGDPDWA
jgi:hypothetical protein